MADHDYAKIGHLKDVAAFREHARNLNLELPCDDRILSAAEGSPLAQAMAVNGFQVGNRWCIHPMEGWDGTTFGEPTEHTLRRWRHFGQSGAKLIWGGEAFAVQADGRANPNQLGIVDDDLPRAEQGLRRLLDELLAGHREMIGNTGDLLVGLQLTHSGRFCRPRDKKKLEPRIAYHHPLLDRKFGIADDDDGPLIGDDYLKHLIDNYVRAAKLAWKVGFRFVDVKHCHGYLGHELLSARTRRGPYGGSLENRARFARQVIEGIRAECPGLIVGVRLSAFDSVPFKPDPARSGGGKLGPGIPEDFGHCLPYLYGFGCDEANPLEIDLADTIAFVKMLGRWGVTLLNMTAGSPYYNPHIQRPAMFPPSDGYQPPEDPLIGVERHIQAVRRLKAACPNTIMVGTGYSYLQEYLPQVSQAVIRRGWADSVGVGRLVLSYWEMPADTLGGRPMTGRRICRTFSDCTTAPRNGIVSGCYPLDEAYKQSAEAGQLKTAKARIKNRLVIP